ncbi:MAG: hypothetical protein HON47_03900 [Candidatus Diapherotrites archaeon]|jgi:hypothetical protein|uniref:Uncharacterized protein n=1 Tax=Candidatus Iainarchaeum sp. TaxID=3101447 RepID=A0A8T5GFD7_9ARCH|nr:hypothetical protein [Candidatus Diapherotrites archaeon]MBT7241524.1 hypothetical protein [Candidatus Diapherotrites archaeon]
MKKIVIILVILLALSLGCTEVKDDGTTMLEFTKLKQDYNVKESYSPDIIIMNDYINDLSKLRAESSIFVSKILDAELASAQSFYYLLIAHEKSREVDFFPSPCSIQKVRNSKEYLETIKFTSLSINKSNAAVDLLASLSATELEHLRPNQLLLVKQYSAGAKGLESELGKICS